MEFFVEIFVELYLKLYNEIFPDRELSAKQSLRLELLCVFVAIGVTTMLLVGIVLLACVENSVAGILLTCIGGVMVLAHFVIFFMLKLAEEKEAVQEEWDINEPEPLIEEYVPNDDCTTLRQNEKEQQIFKD